MAKRFERAHRTGYRLTERDLQIVKAVFEARYLTNDLICRLFFKSTTFSSCKQRMRILFDLGYVKKRSVHLNEPDVHYLGLKGRRHIARIQNRYDQMEIDKIAGVSGDNAEAPTLMMSHDLTLSQLYVNAVLECRHCGFTMLWKNARMLELMGLGIQPDAFLAVEYEGKRRAGFIEFTGVLPNKAEMSRKLAAHTAYLESHRCRADFGVERVAVLWISTSSDKVNKIVRAVQASAYPDYFLVGLLRESGQFVTGPMWQWSESNSPIRWVNPPA